MGSVPRLEEEYAKRFSHPKGASPSRHSLRPVGGWPFSRPVVRYRAKEEKTMNPYVTGAVIKGLREERPHPGPAGRPAQVSDKAVSSGETAKGYPDITLIEAPGPGLDISVMELLSGTASPTPTALPATCSGPSGYVCPICGNIIHSTGAAVLSCCGLTLPPLGTRAPTKTMPSPWSRWRTRSTSP